MFTWCQKGSYFTVLGFMGVWGLMLAVFQSYTLVDCDEHQRQNGVGSSSYVLFIQTKRLSYAAN